MSKSIYVVIGNSDDKLSQERWAIFIKDIDVAVQGMAKHVHGVFFAAPNSPFQNACWSIIIDETDVEYVQRRLSHLASKYSQQSIVWADAETTFLAPKPQ